MRSEVAGWSGVGSCVMVYVPLLVWLDIRTYVHVAAFSAQTLRAPGTSVARLALSQEYVAL